MPTLLDDIRNWFRPSDAGEDATLAPLDTHDIAPAAPHAFVVDDEDGICKVVAMTLVGMGIETEKFHAARTALAALEQRPPAIIFLDVALAGSDAVDVIRGLGERGYGG